ncbi:hypothetical protein AAVH_35767, partial [Aphelenchoides avenae]
MLMTTCRTDSPATDYFAKVVNGYKHVCFRTQTCAFNVSLTLYDHEPCNAF